MGCRPSLDQVKVLIVLSSFARLGQALLDPLVKGFQANGEQPTVVELQDFSGHGDAELVVFAGTYPRHLVTAAYFAGKHTLIIDKGYFHRQHYYRFALDAFQPWYLYQMSSTSDRFRALKLPMNGRQRTNGHSHIMFAGSSDHYHSWHGLPPPAQYAQIICQQIRAITRAPIVYRPKPSWWAKPDTLRVVPSEAELSDSLREPISRALVGCRCVVTHGSNVAVDALRYGVPVLLLSEDASPVRFLASNVWNDLLEPRWPTDEERMSLFSNMAWCQFTLEEVADGLAWDSVRRWVR